MSRLTGKIKRDRYNLETNNVEVEEVTAINVTGYELTKDYATDKPEYYLTGEAVDKLAHYEDLEEQGRLITLPCKVGDTVWAIFPTWTPMECEVVAIEILTSTVNIETKVVDTDADRIFWPADFGNTVFLTKEEAEEALKRLQGNE